MNKMMIVEGMLSFSGTYTYLEQGLPVQDVEPTNCDKGVNLPHVELAAPEYVTC
jgi:hypothetical protein